MADLENPKRFYVTLEKQKDADDFNSCAIELDHPDDQKEEEVEKVTAPIEAAAASEELDFEGVLRTFREAMDGYENFIPLTLWMAPHLAYQMGFKSIHDVAERKGVKIDSCSTDKKTVFELDIEHYQECMILKKRLEVSVSGARHLPEVMLVGLVSVYDAMLSRLLKVVFNKHQEIILTSEKMIKFSDLSTYASIEAARSALIDKEIETVIRESHHEQFAWMERKLSVKLRQDLPIWPTFVEVCERRNLITHTGGIVSAQYLASGRENKFDISKVKLGDKLKVDGDYFRQAINAVYEVGAKLCHVFWRKFSEAQRKEADDALNDLGFSLIRDHHYSLAEALLLFGTKLPRHYSDKMRRMMVINLANAIRLQKRLPDAKLVLQKEDWSAVGDDFKLCVAAVEENEDEVVRLMELLGPNGAIEVESYRNWPVFRGMRTKEKFATAFEKLFGSKLLIPKKSEVAVVKEPKVLADVATGEPEQGA